MGKENKEDIGADLCFRTVCAKPNDMKAFLTIIHLQDSHTSCVNAERELKAQGAEGKAKLTFVDKSEYSISCALRGGGEAKASFKGEDVLLSGSSRREACMPLVATVAFFVILLA